MMTIFLPYILRYVFERSHLISFKEIVSNLEVLEIKYEEENLGLILLYLLPFSYSTFRATILYSHDTLTLDKVYDALFLRRRLILVGSEA